MTRTQYYTATSVGGFIADPDSSLSWLLDLQLTAVSVLLAARQR